MNIAGMPEIIWGINVRELNNLDSNVYCTFGYLSVCFVFLNFCYGLTLISLFNTDYAGSRMGPP